MKQVYYRHLPHIQPLGATIFVTFRLAGSLPQEVIDQLKEEKNTLIKIIRNCPDKARSIAKKELKQLYYRYDEFLHNSSVGPHYLRIGKIAELVCDSMKYWDQKKYDLLAYCVMSNHVHKVIVPLSIKEDEYYSLADIMHSIKSYSASEANKILDRKGQFWTHESFDHYCRSEGEELEVIKYVLNNPVKAGLVKNAKHWKWSYVKEELKDYIG
ncbi:MAG: hypothetical protein GXO92_02630 [FCB group bacterium]|nr:hypothetical protein [FCB group bacterium]